MMEFSSPLAAMHPPPCPPWGNRRDLPASRAMYQSQTVGSNSFNFKELSMKKTAPDYFTMRPARGSSPTASLAADLSSNFHIDQRYAPHSSTSRPECPKLTIHSPQIPTPRRSLFNQNLFLPRDRSEQLATPPLIEYDGLCTPPIPMSSPGDMMDISPLPHKQPCFVAHITLPSPSPEPTEHDDNDMLSCQEALSLPTPEKPTLMPLPERKKSAFLRPSLARSKGHSYSTTSVPQQEHKLPTFKFGGSGLSCTSSPSSECESSPSKSYMIPPSRRTSLCRNNGSPLGSQVRKSAAVRPPPRKQVRRSLSMFQHPDDVINGQQDDYSHINSSPSVSMDLDEPYKPKLPHFINEEEPDSLPRVKQDTLVSVLNGDYNSHYDKILIVDCRFEYEYNGGHINGAVNYNDKDQLTKDLFEHGGVTPNTLLILHCEYSELRAPRMAKFVRNRDRAVNDFQYPKLTFPEMYILEGGYSKFFASHRTKCFPQNYVEMHHKDHEQECEKGMGKLKQRAKLNRAQTYAFGQCHEDSPTSGNRMGSRSLSTIGIFDASPDNSPLSQNLVRRLASY